MAWYWMRQAAMMRHAMLVYGMYGNTPFARRRMRAHAAIVRGFYGF